MTTKARRLRGLVAVAALGALLGCTSGGEPPSTLDPAFAAPQYGDAFWDHWGDGQAELAAYDLTYPRYGEPRRGTVVSIFVTETFGDAQRVKVEGAPEGPGRFPVLKLNLVQDFPTGIYDYNLMTSAFVALEPVNGRPAGTPTKVSFSSQEWCGHVYSQALFDAQAVRWVSHSYFEGEADEAGRLEFPADGLAADVLPFWARGLAGPVLAPGDRRDVRLLRSLERVRLRHEPLAWDRATLARAADVETITVPAGTFAVERHSVTDASGRVEHWYVEAAPPRRIVRWTRGDGLRADLLGSGRMAYWTMNGTAYEQALETLGLTPRPPRTP